MIKVRNVYFIGFNQYIIRKNTTKYSKSQQTTEAGHFLYFDCNQNIKLLDVSLSYSIDQYFLAVLFSLSFFFVCALHI